MESEQNYRQGRPIVPHGEQVFCNGATNQRASGATEYRSVVRDKEDARFLRDCGVAEAHEKYLTMICSIF